MIISALVFLGSAKRIRARKQHEKVKQTLRNTLFFSTTAFAEKFDVIDDPEEVIVDFRESKISDECN
jgi:SulP family sulfate permease